MGGAQSSSCLSPDNKTNHKNSALPVPIPQPPPRVPTTSQEQPGTFPLPKSPKPKQLPGTRPGASPSAEKESFVRGETEDSPQPAGDAGGTEDSQGGSSTASGSGVVLHAGGEASGGTPNSSATPKLRSRRNSADPTGATPLGTEDGSSGGIAGSPQDDKIAELLSMETPLPEVRLAFPQLSPRLLTASIRAEISPFSDHLSCIWGYFWAFWACLRASRLAFPDKSKKNENNRKSTKMAQIDKHT